MALRQINISLAQDGIDRVIAVASETNAMGLRVHPEAQSPGRATVSMISDERDRQDLLDALQRVLAGNEDWRIVILPVETTIPFPDRDPKDEQVEDTGNNGRKIGGRTREEIFNDAWSNAEIGRNFLVFVLLSGVVAAFGMIEDNVAVVIGAMVIAPLLGPVLAFSVGVALGEERLMLRAATSAALGIGAAMALGLFIGLVLPIDPNSEELRARTDIGFDGIAIALASGAAAALSLVTGLSSALVGVMVAVALLPPATASGVFLGAGQPGSSFDALLLLLLNVVCVNLAAQTVMFTRGVTPRTWFEKKRALRGSLINAGVWLFLLAAFASLLLLQAPRVD